MNIDPWAKLGTYQIGGHRHRLVRQAGMPNLVTMWTAHADEQGQTYHYTLGLNAYGNLECVYDGEDLKEAILALSKTASLAVSGNLAVPGGSTTLQISEALRVEATVIEDRTMISQYQNVVRKQLSSTILLFRKVLEGQQRASFST